MVHAILSNWCSIISCTIGLLGILGLNGVVSTLSADIESLTITKGTDPHIAHGEVLCVRLEVMRAIKSMKNEARDESDISLKTILDRNRNKCLEEVKAEGGLIKMVHSSRVYVWLVVVVIVLIFCSWVKSSTASLFVVKA